MTLLHTRRRAPPRRQRGGGLPCRRTARELPNCGSIQRRTLPNASEHPDALIGSMLRGRFAGGDLRAWNERDIEAECGHLRRAPPWNSEAKTDTSSCYEFEHAYRDLRWWRDRCRNRLLHKPTRRAVDRHRTSCRRRCGLRQVGWLPGPRLGAVAARLIDWHGGASHSMPNFLPNSAIRGVIGV